MGGCYRIRLNRFISSKIDQTPMPESYKSATYCMPSDRDMPSILRIGKAYERFFKTRRGNSKVSRSPYIKRRRTAKGSSRKALKTRKGCPSSSPEDPFTSLSLTSEKLLQKLLQTKKRTLKHTCSRVLPSKTAATYSPTFTQYHRRGWA